MKKLNKIKKPKKKVISPKIKVNKLNHNPLFIYFLNWEGDRYTIEKIIYRVLDQLDEKSKKSVQSKIEDILSDSYLNNLSNFQKIFKINIDKAISIKEVSAEFVSWMNNMYKYISEKTVFENKCEERYIEIVNPEGKWLESLFCYNFIMVNNYFGIDIVKKCPICKKYFAHKGKYSKYCSEGCKEIGMRRKK